MAFRPVFLPTDSAPYVRVETVEFEWFPGFAVSQKQRSVIALHEAAQSVLGVGPLLEVSTKSTHRIGVSLSAFNLKLRSEHLGHDLTVEAAFQGSKVFARSGQHPEIYGMTDGRSIKRLIGSYSAETIVGFQFEGRRWATEPPSAFYDWLYLRALRGPVEHTPVREREAIAKELVEFEGFTDIEFNPKRSLNCQARACALYLALARGGRIDDAFDPDQFTELIRLPLAPATSRTRQTTLFDDVPGTNAATKHER